MCNSPEFRSNPFGRPVQHIQAEAQRTADAKDREIQKTIQESEARNESIAKELQKTVDRQVQAVQTLTPKFTPQATRSGASDNQGVRKKKSKKSSIIDANRGVASLRNPLNIGNASSGNSGTGPNIG